jgi:FkbM family methyltransferase
MTKSAVGRIFRGVANRTRRLFNTKARERKNRDEFLSQCRAVIHVGANEGNERETYAAYSLSVIWVEALPEVFQKLNHNLASFPKQQAINALVTNKKDEFYDFHVSNNSGESSSIFDFDDHKQLWPDVSFTNTIRIRSTTLPTLLRDHGLEPSAFDALILDVQGAELLIVEGASEMLGSLRYIKAEAANFSSYKGACTVATLSQALQEHGFVTREKECFAQKAGIGSYYNILYERIAGASTS